MKLRESFHLNSEHAGDMENINSVDRMDPGESSRFVVGVYYGFQYTSYDYIKT